MNDVDFISVLEQYSHKVQCLQKAAEEALGVIDERKHQNWTSKEITAAITLKKEKYKNA